MYKFLFHKKTKILIASVFLIALVASYSRIVFASWNGQLYTPGSTLNPECLPTDVNCDVESPITSTAGLVTTDQTTPQTIGTTTDRLTKLWATNLNVSSAPTFGSLTEGSIVFAGAGGVISDDNTNLYWDNVNKQLKVGTPPTSFDGDPLFSLSVSNNVNSYSGMYTQNASSGVSASSDYMVGADNDGDALQGHFGDFGVINSGWDPAQNVYQTGMLANDVYLYGSGGNLLLGTDAGVAGKVIKFFVGGFTAADQMATLSRTGFGIGTTTPGSALDVKGTIRISGSSSGYVGFSVPSAAGSTTYVLPNTDGTNNYVLTTDGNGNLSWSDKTGGTPGTVSSINGSSSALQTIAAGSGLSIVNSGATHTLSLDTSYAPNWTGTHIFSNSVNSALFTGGNVGIGTLAPTGLLSVTPLQYNTGTASQDNSTTIVGSGTTWTSAMVGSQFVYADGTSAGTITAVADTTHLTSSVTQTVVSQGYNISYNSLNVATNGNVGVGTTSPGAKFDVYSATNVMSSLQVGESLATKAVLNGSSTRFKLFTMSRIGDGATELFAIGSGTGPTSTSTVLSSNNDNIILGYHTGTTFTETMRLNTSGNVGIGTASPIARLDVQLTPSATIGSSLQSYIGGGNGTSGHLYQIGFGRSSVTYPSSVVGAVNMSGTGSGYSDIFFATRSVTTDTAPTERMRITSTGNVGIGTTSFVGSIKLAVNGQIGGPTYSASYLDVSGATPELRGNSGLGYYSASGDHIFYGASSAERMRITSAGNIGIGTTNTTAYLDINPGNVSTKAVHIGTPTGSQASALVVTPYNATTTPYLIIDRKGSIGINTGTIDSDLTYPLNIAPSVATSNTAPVVADYINPYAGVGASGIGATFQFRASNSNGNIRQLANLSSLFTTTTQGSEVSAMTFNLYKGDGVTGVTAVEAARITSSGYFGIGTTSPSLKLHVDSGAGGAPATSGLTQANGAVRINGADNGVLDIGAYGSGRMWLQVTDQLQLASTYSLLLQPNGGNVGIGAASPVQVLDIYKATSAYLNVGSNNAGIAGLDLLEQNTTFGFGSADSAGFRNVYNGADNKLYWQSANGAVVNTRMTIDRDSGNIGMGTTSPTQKLHVSGTILSDSAVYTANGVSEGNQVFSNGGTTSILGVGNYQNNVTNPALLTNPLGVSFGSVGVTGFGATAHGGGTNGVGVYGYGIQSGLSAASANNMAVGGAFVGQLTSAAGSTVSYGGKVYGVYALGDSSLATASTGSVYGTYSTATGRAGDVTYGGYFSASGGTNNYGLVVNSGNVGIGTTSPSYPLHVNQASGSGIDPGLKISQNNTLAGMNIYESNGVGSVYFDNFGDNVGYNTYFRMRTSGTPVNILTLRGSGNVGIGTTSPANVLDVEGSVAIGSLYSGTSAGPTNGLIVQGDVGFGTTSPVSKLHVGVAPTASANYGTVSIGSGAFDGATSGFYVGGASGTSVAVNEVSGYAGNLVDMQVAGASKFKVSNTGALTMGSSITASGTNFQLGTDSGKYIRTTDQTGVASANGKSWYFGAGNTTQNDGSQVFFRNTNGSRTPTSGTNNFISIDETFAPTSGNAAYRPLSVAYTLNSTGTTSGAVATGIYLNAIETSLTGTTHTLMDLQVSGTSKFKVARDGKVNGSNGADFGTGYVSSLGFTNNNAFQFNNTFLYSAGGSATAATSGTRTVYENVLVWSQSSGNAVYNGFSFESTINQTGTANAITRGMYINPTLTSATDFRAMEIANNSQYAIYQSGASAKNYFNGNTSIGNTNSTYKLEVGSSGVTGIVSRFVNSTGTCDINPTTTALSCSSDRNLKTNISNLNSNMLDTITGLQPVTYNWNADPNGQVQTGFIAQDVEAIFPNLVSTDANTGLKSLNYIGLIPYSIEAIKELDLKVENLGSLISQNNNSMPSMVGDFFSGVVVQVSGTMASLKDITVETLHVGSPAKRTGITIYDEATGEPFCIKVVNGAMQTVAGECGIVTPQQDVVPAPEEIPPQVVVPPASGETPPSEVVPPTSGDAPVSPDSNNISDGSQQISGGDGAPAPSSGDSSPEIIVSENQ